MQVALNAGTATAVMLACAVVLGASGCGGGGGGSAPVRVPTSTPLLATPSPPPNPLFVRSSGRDDSSGADADNALRTITRALEIAPNGATIIVGPGMYTERVAPDEQGLALLGTVLQADATGRRTGDRPAPVVIDATDSGEGTALSLSFSSGVLVDGFTITGGAGGGIALRASDNAIIQNCIVFGNAADGITVEDSFATLLLNNLVYRNKGYGIRVAGRSVGSPNARIISNSIVDNDGPGLTIGSVQRESPAATVRNNIIQGNGDPANLRVLATTSLLGYALDFNLVFPSTYVPDGAKGAHDINRDAEFVDLEAADFHLRSGSPAIDQNSALALSDTQQRILRQRTTTGAGLDAGLLDLGFHFLR